MKKIVISLICISTLMLSCGKTNNTSTPTLSEIVSKESLDEGFADIKLIITDDVKTDSAHIYLAKGLYKGKTVGIKFELKANIPNGMSTDGEMTGNGFVAKALTISTIGAESDELLKALAEVYETPTTKQFTATPITATVFSLNQTVADLDKKTGTYKFKVFLEDDKGEHYAEMYFNINLQTREIELREKDSEYRQTIIDSFSGSIK